MDEVEVKEQALAIRQELDGLAERIGELLDIAVSNPQHYQALIQTFDAMFELTAAVIGERDGAINDLIKLEHALDKWYATDDERVQELVGEVSEEAESETIQRTDENVANNLILLGGLEFDDYDAAVLLAEAMTASNDYTGMLTGLMQDAENRPGVLAVLDKFRQGLEKIEVQESVWE